MDCRDGTFLENQQMPVGHDGGDLDDDIPVRVQPRHFEIDPDQVIPGLHFTRLPVPRRYFGIVAGIAREAAEQHFSARKRSMRSSIGNHG